MEDKKKIPSETKAPDNLIIYDPDKPLYQKLHLCIYLRELLDETEYVGIATGKKVDKFSYNGAYAGEGQPCGEAFSIGKKIRD